MMAAAGHDLDDTGVGLAHAVRRETDGNPFFTGELLRHLGETGGIVLGDDGRWTVAGGLDELGLPRSVRDVVGRRVERLGDEALRVLSLGAVIGREFEIGILARVADVEEDDVLDLVEAAVGAAILAEGAGADRYRFAHALIQHSLYDELSPARRQRTHKRVAEVLEEREPSADPAALADLAHHWVAATRPTDLGKALQYVRRAGDAARAVLAPHDAIRWYSQALELLAREPTPDLRLRASLLAVLGTVQRQVALPESRATLLEAAALARDVNDPEALVLAALGFSKSSVLEMEGDGALKPIITAALNTTSAQAPSVRARLLVELALAHDAGTEWRDRRDLALQAVEIARASNDDALFVAVLGTDGMMNTLATPDRVELAIEDFQRARRLADNLSDPALRASSRGAIVWSRYQQADVAGVDEVLADFGACTAALGLPGSDHVLGRFLVGRQILDGHADDAEAANDHLLEVGTAIQVGNALGSYGGFLFAIRQHQGRLNEIADLIVQTAQDNPSITGLGSAIVAMLCELGRIEEARARLAVEISNGFDYPFDSIWLAAMANLMDAAATLDDQSSGRVLANRLAPYANQVIAPSGALVTGALARPLARVATVLADYDQAESWFLIAHDIHTRLQAPYWTARGQLDHADLCLARRGDSDLDRARQLAMSAADTAAEYGCAGLEGRAEAVLTNL